MMITPLLLKIAQVRSVCSKSCSSIRRRAWTCCPHNAESSLKRRPGALQPLPLQQSSSDNAQVLEVPFKQPKQAGSPKPPSKKQQHSGSQPRERGIKRPKEPAGADSDELPPPSPPKKAKATHSPAKGAGGDSPADSQPVTMRDLKELLAQLVPAHAAASAVPDRALSTLSAPAALTLAAFSPASPASAVPAATVTPQVPPVGAERCNDDGWLAVKAQAESLWANDQLAKLKFERDTLLLRQAYQAGQRSRY